VTLDIDGETRNATTPYIGADELVGGISTVGTLSAVDTTYWYRLDQPDKLLRQWNKPDEQSGRDATGWI
jgi:hypothetical protein